MKRIIFVILLVLSTQGYGAGYNGEECADRAGRVFIGNNGTVYCASRIAMNWWTALEWCRAIRMEAVEGHKECKCTGDSCPVSGCPNFMMTSGDLHFWASEPWDNTNGTRIYATPSSTLNGWVKTAGNFAICKPK